MPKLVFSEFVEPELAAIWDYIALDNPVAADNFLEAAQLAFRELALTPGLGRARKFPQAHLHHLHSFRIRNFDNYLIFYRPVSNGIEVFHVLHGARDLENF